MPTASFRHYNGRQPEELQAKIKECEAEGRKALEDIECHDFFRNRFSPIPVSIPDAIAPGKKQAIEITNGGDQIGLFLFCIKLLTAGAADARVYPDSVRGFIHEKTETAGTALRNIDTYFSGVSNPAFKSAYIDACEKCRMSIVTLLQVPENRHALQMAYLVVKDTEANASLRDALKKMLVKSGAPQCCPEKLQTPLECALAVEALFERKHGEDKELLMPLVRHYAAKAGIALRLEGGRYHICGEGEMPDPPALEAASLPIAQRKLDDWLARPGSEQAQNQARLIRDYIARERGQGMGGPG